VSGVNIPQDYTVHLNPVNLTGGIGLGLSGGLMLDAGLDNVDVSIKATGDPSRPIAVDLGLDNIHVKVDPLELKLDPLEIKLDPLELKLDPVKVDLGLDNINVCLSLAVTEFPRMRVCVPTKYDFGVCLLGIPIVKFSVAGETVIVTQDNPPRLFQKVADQPSGTGLSNTSLPKSANLPSAPKSHDEPFRVGIT
jgi:hypothetical protein